MKSLSLVAILFLNACAIKGNFAGLYSYHQKMISQNPTLYETLDATESACNLVKAQTPKVYILNGKQLKDCLQVVTLSVVYIWSPKCKSEKCIPLELIQQQCTRQKIDLYIVAEYYDNEMMSIDYKLNRPIFGINTKYYSTDLTSKYLSRFTYDLTESSEIGHKFLFFDKGIFKGSYTDLKEFSAEY